MQMIIIICLLFSVVCATIRIDLCEGSLRLHGIPPSSSNWQIIGWIRPFNVRSLRIISVEMIAPAEDFRARLTLSGLVRIEGRRAREYEAKSSRILLKLVQFSRKNRTSCLFVDVAFSITKEAKLIVRRRDTTFAFSSAAYSASVSEDSPAGTAVVTVIASGDNGTITYEIVNSDRDFNIDPYTESIRTAVELDRETQSTYQFLVTAQSSSTSKTATATVSVEIIDVNDNEPLFEKSPYLATVLEDAQNGSYVTVVKATDPDEGANGEVTYSLSPNDYFDIERLTGIVRSIKNFDYDKQSSFTITAYATDGGKYCTSKSLHL